METILARLYEAANGDLMKAERGIIFIDEIDKKRKEVVKRDGRDINGESVQQELLKILEPNTVDVPISTVQTIHFHTGRLTVFMCGAFVGLDQVKKKRLQKENWVFSELMRGYRRKK